MDRLIGIYCRWLERAVVIALALMVVLVFGNVVLRYGFNSGITESEELSRWLFVWMTFLGAIIAFRERAHLGTDFVVRALPYRGRLACFVIGQVAMLYVTWLVFSGALTQARINWTVEAPVTGASVAIFYTSGLVFAVSTALLLLRDLWRALTGRLSDAELIQVQEDEESGHLATPSADEDRRPR